VLGKKKKKTNKLKKPNFTAKTSPSNNLNKNKTKKNINKH
jgi:hypothetical protein